MTTKQVVVNKSIFYFKEDFIMITCKEEFNFIDKHVGITKEGEQYLSLNVISKDNKKFNFITKDTKLIDKVSPLNLQRFSIIKLILEFRREFNREKRISYWTCNLIGVE